MPSTIEETYRARLALLVEQFGTQSALAEAIGKSPAQVSQWINASADSKTGRPRGMHSDTARGIEKKLSLPDGWMDQPIEEPSSSSDPAAPAPGTSSTSLGSGDLEPSLRSLSKAVRDLAPALQGAGRTALLLWLEEKISASACAETLESLQVASKNISSDHPESIQKAVGSK